jgi:hypothetical protein
MAHFMTDSPRRNATAALNLRPLGEGRSDRNQTDDSTEDAGYSSRDANGTPTSKQCDKYGGDVKKHDQGQVQPDIGRRVVFRDDPHFVPREVKALERR